jgi:hypothetical protein
MDDRQYRGVLARAFRCQFTAGRQALPFREHRAGIDVTMSVVNDLDTAKGARLCLTSYKSSCA